MVPLTVDVTGRYDSLEALLGKIEGLRRAYLVTGVSVQPGDGTTDDLKMSITGRVFTRSPNTAGAGATPAATPAQEFTGSNKVDTTGGLG